MGGGAAVSRGWFWLETWGQGLEFLHAYHTEIVSDAILERCPPLLVAYLPAWSCSCILGVRGGPLCLSMTVVCLRLMNPPPTSVQFLGGWWGTDDSEPRTAFSRTRPFTGPLAIRIVQRG